jgi:hypothetical protein
VTRVRASTRFSPRIGAAMFLFVFLATALFNAHDALSQAAPSQLYITMHSAPIDDYCPPCIASEKLLKEAGLDYRKVLEPLGPWPWFQFTDSQGNQRRLAGGLTADDINRIKKGEWPQRAN